jgi:RNA polymerase sigma factor (sigma-70 family)
MGREQVERARDGDHAAFSALAAEAVNRLFGVAQLILRDADAADDAVQEALVHAWQRLPSLRDPDRWDGWLYRLVVNACSDQRRRQRRFEATVRVLRAEPAEEDTAAAVADREQLERAFRRMSVDHRSIVVLHLYVGLTLAAAADALEIPVGTAKSRLHHALASLRAAIDADARTLVEEATA